MPTIPIRWSDNTKELAANLRAGLDQIEATKAAADKLAKSLGGENLVRAAHTYVAALEQIGGQGGAIAAVERQTNSERQRTIDLLQKAIAKYELLGKEAPAAMREVLAAAMAAQRPVSTLAEQAANVQRQFEKFSGDKVVSNAHAIAAAVEKVGGASKLTAANQELVNREVTAAIEQYRVLGQVAPQNLLDIAAATQKVAVVTDESMRAARWEQTTQSLQQFGSVARTSGTALTAAITVPLVGLGTAASKFAIDFESSFAGVRKTIDATEPQFAQMAQAFRDLAKTIPVNVNDLNRLGEAAGALGVPQEQVVEFAKVMAELGVTTDVTADQAATAIAKIQNIFGAAGKQTEEFASTLVDLGNKGASTESEILALTGRIAGAGHAVGLSQSQVLGFAAAIANVGIEAEAGGSAMSRVFADLSLAVSKGGAQLEDFARIAGMSGKAFADLFRKDAAQATTAFIEGLGKIQKSGGDLIATLEDLGFKELRQADLLKRLAGSGDNLAASLRTSSKAWAENSALSEEARKRFATTESQLAILWNRIKDVGITIGNALLPGIKSLIGAADAMVPIFERAAKAFAALPGPVQALAIGFAAVAAVVGPALLLLGQLAISATALTTVFASEGVAATALGASLTFLEATYAALLTPITAYTVGMAASTLSMTISGAAAQALAASLGLVRGALMLISAHPLVALVAAVGAAITAYALYKEKVADAALATQTQAAKQDTVNLAIQRGATGLSAITDAEQRYTEAIKYNNDWLRKSTDSFEQYLKVQQELRGIGASATQQVKALSDALVKAGEQGKLGPEQLKRFAEQAVALKKAGGELTPALENAVRAIAILDKAAGPPQASFDGLRKMVSETASKLASLDPVIRRDLVAAIQQGVHSVKDMAEAARTTEDVVELLKKQMESATKSTSKWAEANATLSAAVEGLNWDGTVEGALNLGVAVETVATYFGMASGAVKRTKADLELFGRVSKDVAEESTSVWKKWAAEQEKIADLRDQAFVKNNEIAVESARRAADEMAKDSLTSFEYQRRQVLEWQNTAEGAINYTEDNWIDAYAAIAMEAKQKLDSIREAEEAESIKLSYEFVGPMEGGPSSGPSIGKQLKDSLGAALKGFPDLMVQSLTGGGGFMGAINAFASQIGGLLSKALGAELTKSIGGMLGKIVGSIVGPLGALLGPLLDKIAGFFHKSEAEKLMHDVGRDWGMQISAGLSKQMEADSNKFGRQAAELLHLKDIFAEAGGINAGNVDAAAKHLRDVFSLIETHQLTIAQGAKIIDDNWSDLLAAGTDSFGFISDRLKEIIDLDQRFGTQSKEVAAFLKQQADVAVSASNDVIASIAPIVKGWQEIHDRVEAANKAWDEAKKKGDMSAMVKADKEWAVANKELTELTKAHKQELEDLGVVALATFSAAIAAGKTFAEALEAAGPGLQTLIDGFKALNIETDNAALKALMLQSQMLSNNPALVKGVSSLGQTFAALSNMGLLNVDTFSAMQRTGLQMYQRLQAGAAAVGGTTRDALIPMQDYLHQAQKAAEELGIPLDENTQILIDQSKELGIWKEAGKSATQKLTDGMQALVDKVQELINTLLGIPKEIKTNIIVDTQHTGDGPPPTDTTEHQYNPPKTEYDAQPLSRGGRVTRSGVQYFDDGGPVLRVPNFKPIGRDVVPAMLRYDEMVLTPEQQSVVGTLMAQASPSSGDGSGGGAVTYNVKIEATDAHSFEELMRKRGVPVVIDQIQFDKGGAKVAMRNAIR